MKVSALFGSDDALERVYGKGRRKKIEGCTQLYASNVNRDNFCEHAPNLGEVEAIFSTWGMPLLSPEQLNSMPRLGAVFFAGGSVQHFARPLLERGIVVVSAWQANAIPVSEFTLAQILLATKGYFRNSHGYASPSQCLTDPHFKGNFGETVAILGAGAIGRRVIELLRPFNLKVIVFDPFLNEEAAVTLGVEKVTLEAAFERAYVVSNHLADLPETVGLLNGGLFERMRPNGTFINTGRGRTVDEEALIRTLQAQPDITALLDVTYPEPPVAGSLFYTLSNAHLSTHIAGSIGDELARMADYCLEEFMSWEKNAPLKYAVSLAMLETMA